MAKRQKAGKHIKVICEGNILDITKVDEYSCGHKYFYIRFLDSRDGEKTISLLRRDIVEVIYETSNSQWRKVNLKKQLIK